MTNTILPLPTDDSTIIALLRDTIKTSADSLSRTATYFADRLDCISDYDDYAPAILGIMTACTRAILDHEHDTYADLLSALMNDPEFQLDLETCDETLPLHDFIRFPLDDD